MSIAVQLTPYFSFRPEDVSPELFRRFLERFDHAGGNLKMIQDVAHDPLLMERLIHFFKEEDAKMCQIVRFTYDMPLADMIAAGQYDDVDPPPYIPRELKKSPEMVGEVRMPHLYKVRGTYWPKELPTELGRHGLRSATFPELLLYGANSQEQRHRLMIFILNDQTRNYGELIGLSCGENGKRRIASYSSSGGDLPSGWNGFNEHHRIAVVRE